MLPKIISPTIIMSPRRLVPIFFILCVLVSGCITVPPPTPTPQVLENTPSQTSVDDIAELFSSDSLGLCFSYPQGYTQLPYNDTVEIVAPEIPGFELRGGFWLEKSDPYNRTAEVIADQDVAMVPGLNPDRWTVMLGGEGAVVLDGMPGQDLTRKVYIVHEQTLYILTFNPTRSENTAAVNQMEALYAAVTSSWAWSPCSTIPGVLESTPVPSGVDDTAEWFSSDSLGLCFSYPRGYIVLPYNDTVQIVAPEIPGSDLRGLFWLEKGDPYNRTAEVIADQDVAMVSGLSPDRWTVTLGGEQAVVLDGMPGQDPTRKVYIVHEQTLYILTFNPTRSENTAAVNQMEALYAAVTSSWAWSPCSAGE